MGIERTKKDKLFNLDIANDLNVSNNLDVANNLTARMNIENSTFVAVDSSNAAAASSTDGITWTARTMPSSQIWRSVIYGNPIIQKQYSVAEQIEKLYSLLP